MVKNETVDLLTKLGFTETQATIYSTLLRIKETEAKTLAKEANISSQVTYRTLDELIAKGIVEKKLSVPNKYQAIPLEATAELVLNAKAEEYSSALEQTNQLLSQYNKENLSNEKNQDYFISIVEGKDTIINRNRAAHANSLVSVDVCTSFQRLIQIDRGTNETVQNALERGVFYRVVIEKPEGELCLPEDLKKLVTKKNFQLKITSDRLKVNAAIFDEKMCSFSFYPAKDIVKSPMIWTNHPSIVTCFQEHFKETVRNTKKYSSNKNSEQTEQRTAQSS